MTWADRESLSATYSRFVSPDGFRLTNAEHAVYKELQKHALLFVNSSVLIDAAKPFRNSVRWDAALASIVNSLRKKGYRVESARALRGEMLRGNVPETLPRGTKGYRLVPEANRYTTRAPMHPGPIRRPAPWSAPAAPELPPDPFGRATKALEHLAADAREQERLRRRGRGLR